MTLRRCLAARALLSALLALVAVQPCLAQRSQIPGGLKPLSADLSPPPGKEGPPYGQRTDAFRRLLFELKFNPLTDFAQLQETPDESLLIVLGDPSCLTRSHFPEGLRAFVEQGGAVLIATDMKTSGEAGELLRKLAGVEVSGEKLVCRSLEPDALYEGHADCPFVQPVAALGGENGAASVAGALATVVGVGSRPALFRDPHPDRGNLKVATNAPSRLKLSSWWLRLPIGLSRLAHLPRDCVDESHSIFIDATMTRQMKRLQQVQDEEPLFAVGGTVGKGRVLVLADHSIFINRMMLPRDNKNLEFAANSLHWLRGGVSTPMDALRAAKSSDALKQLTGKRDKVLFWDDGTIHKDFNVPLKPVARKPVPVTEPALVAALDRTIARMEDNDYFNRRILDGVDDLPGGRKQAVRFAVYGLTLAVFLFVAYRFLWRSRHVPEMAVPLLAEAVRDHEPRLPLLEQRRRALVRAGNFWETAHRLAREYFQSIGVSLTGASPPRVEVRQGGWRQRRRINRRLAHLWHLARGATPAPLSAAALQRWLRELEALKTALREIKDKETRRQGDKETKKHAHRH